MRLRPLLLLLLGMRVRMMRMQVRLRRIDGVRIADRMLRVVANRAAVVLRLLVMSVRWSGMVCSLLLRLL